jgi:hypothetical protein
MTKFDGIWSLRRYLVSGYPAAELGRMERMDAVLLFLGLPIDRLYDDHPSV